MVPATYCLQQRHFQHMMRMIIPKYVQSRLDIITHAQLQSLECTAGATTQNDKFTLPPVKLTVGDIGKPQLKMAALVHLVRPISKHQVLKFHTSQFLLMSTVLARLQTQDGYNALEVFLMMLIQNAHTILRIPHNSRLSRLLDSIRILTSVFGITLLNLGVPQYLKLPDMRMSNTSSVEAEIQEMLPIPLNIQRVQLMAGT